MKKEDIIKLLKESPSNGTLLNFPKRGPWGDSAYRGNCSGFIHAFLLNQYKVKKWLSFLREAERVRTYAGISAYPISGQT